MIYNILLTFLLLSAIPYLLLRSLIQKRFRKKWVQRMGFLPHRSFKKPIWVHAASVGEVLCSVPLLKRIKRGVPHCEIILTTMTSTGNETAKTLIPEADQVLFFPVDHPFTIRRALRRIDPRLLLVAETELWPNLLHSCGRRKIPIVLFNGRISEKSFRGYLFLKSFFKRCLEYVSFFLMQTEEDRGRIIEIGAPPDKTKVVGNIKFDQAFLPLTEEAMVEMSISLSLQRNDPILIAGSTHSGEEEILISLFKDLREHNPRLILILAPRHLDRLEEVERILEKESLSWKRRTSIAANLSRSGEKDSTERSGVILLDTMGELMSLYSLGTLIFIGGSLVPVGGHNPLEPLFFKKCVLFGPHMFNFVEISRHLIAEGGAIQVSGKEDLASQLKRLLSDEKARNEVGEKGYRFLQKHRGATERIFEEIRPFLT
ncbi:MAG: 3-deoxy-D-manno-octulosonic acid transferase [Thermodesulfobacteriota bacterium]|nr:3-deoxy-D-manno-octulosonic acid transferase [Thermodesulfobacteriota bacterium]